VTGESEAALGLTPETARQRAGDLYDEGFDCAEALVRVFVQLGVVQDVDVDTLYRLATGFGKGMGSQEASCGALSGAVLVLNAVFGPPARGTKAMYKVTGRFSRRFVKRFGTLTCRELRRQSTDDCKDTTCEAAGLLAEFLAKELSGHGRANRRGERT